MWRSSLPSYRLWTAETGPVSVKLLSCHPPAELGESKSQQSNKQTAQFSNLKGFLDSNVITPAGDVMASALQAIEITRRADSPSKADDNERRLIEYAEMNDGSDRIAGDSSVKARLFSPHITSCSSSHLCPFILPNDIVT